MNGVVVHARRGERDAYRPIVSPLSSSAEPIDVVRGLLSLHPFRALYIADLDAILHGRPHDSVIAALRRAFPQLDLWLDRGIRTVAHYEAAAGFGRPVIGSETLAPRSMRAVLAHARAGDPSRGGALSIDVRDGAILGSARLSACAPSWPSHVIAMSLRRVGAGSGPDLELVARLQKLASHARVFAAGGVRHLADLRAARDAGCAGALIATSLHDGSVTSEELRQFK